MFHIIKGLNETTISRCARKQDMGQILQLLLLINNNNGNNSEFNHHTRLLSRSVPLSTL